MGSHLVAVVLLLLLISDPYTRLAGLVGRLSGMQNFWVPERTRLLSSPALLFPFLEKTRAIRLSSVVLVVVPTY